MAYLVAKKPGTWEIRESQSTDAGPRSRTLATFRELTPEVIERAIQRATTPLGADDLLGLARRAGAPVAKAPADAAAATLLSELARGRSPSPALHRLLVAALGPADREATDSERAVAPWIAATPTERGEALRDLLSLADALPARADGGRPRFPRIDSAS